MGTSREGGKGPSPKTDVVNRYLSIFNLLFMSIDYLLLRMNVHWFAALGEMFVGDMKHFASVNF